MCDEKDFSNTLLKVKQRIISTSEKVMQIFEEKKYYDKYIHIYVELFGKKIKTISDTEENNFIKKINEILNFMSHLDINSVVEFANNKKFQYVLINKDNIIKDYINKDYENKIIKVFYDISGFFKDKEKVFID